MSAFKIDGTFTAASAINLLSPSYPLGDRDTTAILYTQRFMVFKANYAAPTIGSANGTHATAYCVGDTNFEALAQNIITYDRQWATVPANRSEYSSFAFQFPGLLGSSNPPYSGYWQADIGGGRDPRTETVQSRILHEYFLCVAGEAYPTPADIPVIEAFRVTLDLNEDAVMPYCLPAGTYWSDTSPTKEEYQSSITGGDELVAESSVIERYQGAIYERRTRYVTAK